MASKDKVFERRNRILTELEGGPVSIKALAETLGVKERSVESDIKALRESGSEIHIEKQIVTLKKRVEVTKESSAIDVRAVTIIMLLGESRNGLTKTEIEDGLLYDISYALKDRKDIRKKESASYEEAVSKNDDAFRKRVEEDLKRLVEQKKINKIGNKYFVAMNTPVQISLSDRNLDAIYRELVNNCDQNTYGDILFQITKKVYEAVDLKLYGKEIHKVDPIILQNEKNSYEKYENALKSLFAVDYKNKRIKIKRVDRRNNVIEGEVFSVGMIVFVAEDGNFYLMGKTDLDYEKDEKETKKWKKYYTPIKLSRVETIEEVDQSNKEYGKKEYEKICSEMYKFSIDNSFNVTLEYKNTPGNQKKVRKYSQNRETFVIKETTENKIICTDRVRGRYDYERFLRKEGNDVIVKYPNFIISDMAESAKKIIERYRNE